MDGSEDFVRTWLDYKNGFGIQTSEFWLGKTWGNFVVVMKQVNLKVILRGLMWKFSVNVFHK